MGRGILHLIVSTDSIRHSAGLDKRPLVLDRKGGARFPGLDCPAPNADDPTKPLEPDAPGDLQWDTIIRGLLSISAAFKLGREEVFIDRSRVVCTRSVAVTF